jgi:hypothetical protein
MAVPRFLPQALVGFGLQSNLAPRLRGHAAVMGPVRSYSSCTSPERNARNLRPIVVKSAVFRHAYAMGLQGGSAWARRTGPGRSSNRLKVKNPDCPVMQRA